MVSQHRFYEFRLIPDYGESVYSGIHCYKSAKEAVEHGRKQARALLRDRLGVNSVEVIPCCGHESFSHMNVIINRLNLGLTDDEQNELIDLSKALLAKIENITSDEFAGGAEGKERSALRFFLEEIGAVRTVKAKR